MSLIPKRLAPIVGRSLGVYRVTTVRDGVSREREGWPVYAIRRLGSAVIEVLFEDGTWLLCASEDIERA